MNTEDFTKALAECIKKAQCAVVDPMAHAEIWKEELLELAKGKELVSEELEEEMESFFIKMQVQENENIFEDTFKNIARHFANWQKQKDDKHIGELQWNAHEEGWDECKQQMMKNAKEGVITFDYYGDNDKIYGCIAHDSFSLEELGLKEGDKVKLIIIKED